jgi:hypothetical protein
MPQYYLDSPNFATATAVYANATLTVLAPDGYYSSHGIVRSQVNGQLTAYAECESCKEYQKPVEGELLLDLYPGAAAAYSLDQLNTSYSGAAIRVRRASDSTEQDIGFTEEFTLDTAALEAFCTGTDGFVAVWYDQSSGGNNATQATASNQPKIYDASTGVVTDNGKSAVEFDGTNDVVIKTSVAVTNEFVSVFGVQSPDVANVSQVAAALTNESAGTRRGIWFRQTGEAYASGFANNLKIGNYSGATRYLATGFFDNAANTISGSFNGTFTAAASYTLNNLSSPHIAIGEGNGGFSEFFNGKIQEVIIYPSDQSAKRAGIESDINSRYQIYWDGTVTSLLDTYPDAAAGYSLRALNSSYTGPIVRVRRASDSAETDVYALYNGDLNTSAIESFCTGTDGYVAVWYDQSGEGNDAEQATAASQPKIYDASTGGLLDNGKPALNLDGVNDFLKSSNFASLIGAPNFFTAAASFADTSDAYFIDSDSPGRSATGIIGGNWSIRGLNGGSASSGQYLVSVSQEATTAYMYVDGVQKISNANASLVTHTNVLIGDDVLYFEGKIHELILWPSDQSANRAGIESNINQAYNIYWDGTVTALLDDYQGAAAAYSVRALNSFYTGPLVRVRRESDNAEQDIRALYNGELDTSALASFSAGTNAYVAVWYDQSSNANDATQATTGLQPKIYDASTGVNLDNAVTALGFNGANALNTTASISASSSDYTIYFVENRPQSVNYSLDTSTGRIILGNNQGAYYDGAFQGSSLTQGAQALNGYYLLNAGAYISENGSVTQSGLSYTRRAISGSTSLFAHNNQVSRFVTGNLQAVIIYAADKSADRAGIESALNEYFNIY